MGPESESTSLQHLHESAARRRLPFDEHLRFGLRELGYLIRPFRSGAFRLKMCALTRIRRSSRKLTVLVDITLGSASCWQ